MAEEPNKPGGPAFVPGFEQFDQVVQSYNRAWEMHRRAVTKLYGDLTSQGANLNTWTGGVGNLLNTWTESARDIYKGFFAGLGDYSHATGAGPVIFVIDRTAAETGPQAMEVCVHPRVDRSRVFMSPLTRLADGATLPTGVDGHLRLELDDSGSRMNLSVTNLKILGPAEKAGTYSTLLYERSNPPPYRALATVEIHFV